MESVHPGMPFCYDMKCVWESIPCGNFVWVNWKVIGKIRLLWFGTNKQGHNMTGLAVVGTAWLYFEINWVDELLYIY